MIPTYSRAGEILSVADSTGGGITMPVIYSMFPAVEPNILRRTVTKMCDRGALRAVACSDLGGRRVYLTTRGVNGRAGGLQRMLVAPDQREVVLPEKFAHSLIAAQLAYGLGEEGTIPEREIWRGRAPNSRELVSDGVAEIQPGWRIEIEVEMMVHQSPVRWTKKKGLVHRIAASCRPDNSLPRGLIKEVLVVAPVWLSRFHPDSEVELDAMVRTAAAKNFENRVGAGWWFLPIDDLESDPVWHPVFPQDCEPPNGQLLGLASRRNLYQKAHEKRSEIDRVRKNAAREKREREEAQKRSADAPVQPAKSVLSPGTLSYEESLELERELGLGDDA